MLSRYENCVFGTICCHYLFQAWDDDDEDIDMDLLMETIDNDALAAAIPPQQKSPWQQLSRPQRESLRPPTTQGHRTLGCYQDRTQKPAVSRQTSHHSGPERQHPVPPHQVGPLSSHCKNIPGRPSVLSATNPAAGISTWCDVVGDRDTKSGRPQTGHTTQPTRDVRPPAAKQPRLETSVQATGSSHSLLVKSETKPSTPVGLCRPMHNKGQPLGEGGALGQVRDRSPC